MTQAQFCTPATFSCLLRRKGYFLMNDLTFEEKENHAAQMLSRDTLVPVVRFGSRWRHIMQTLETLRTVHESGKSASIWSTMLSNR